MKKLNKKPIMLVATTLIALLVLTPLAHAGVVHFWWDNVYFVDGTVIDYAHPDHVYYGISPSSDWTRQGDDLHHHQINRDTSYGIVVGTVVIVEVLLLILFRHLPQTTTAYYVAGLGGIALATFVGVILDELFVDERGCMWLWIGRIFMTYLLENLDYLSGLYKEEAIATIISAFICYGYFRIGKVTFNDPLGIGDPSSDPPPRNLYISVNRAEAGTVSPPCGVHTYDYGEVVTVTAYPAVEWGFKFKWWILDGTPKAGQDVSWYNQITVTMDSDHTLQACFGVCGGSGCPTLFVWNGSSYESEGILNIHADSDITLQHEIENTLALENGFYNLQLREIENNTSHIDQVRLYAVDYEGEWHLCPLTYAIHNTLGKVKHTLRFDDSNRVDLKPTETISLKFAPPISYDKTVQFTFEINGYNMKIV